MCCVCFLIERTGKLLRDCEVLSAAMISLNPQFPGRYLFCQNATFFENVFPTVSEGFVYFLLRNKYCQQRITCRRVYFISLWILFPGAFNTSEHVSSQKVITDGWIGKFVEVNGLVQILGITLPFFWRDWGNSRETAVNLTASILRFEEGIFRILSTLPKRVLCGRDN